MRDLINNLKKAIEESKLQCATRKPDVEREASYLLGYLQGKYTGLNEALKLVEGFLDAEEQQEEFR